MIYDIIAETSDSIKNVRFIKKNEKVCCHVKKKIISSKFYSYFALSIQKLFKKASNKNASLYYSSRLGKNDYS